ncbi:MAG: hypothetical protein K1Y02_18990 [Candidatus Hydrogenedentes bacterium]|nr:hypothetical protein [Candidatus Hydrogenedentota bacterium]
MKTELRLEGPTLDSCTATQVSAHAKLATQIRKLQIGETKTTYSLKGHTRGCALFIRFAPIFEVDVDRSVSMDGLSGIQDLLTNASLPVELAGDVLRAFESTDSAGTGVSEPIVSTGHANALDVAAGVQLAQGESMPVNLSGEAIVRDMSVEHLALNADTTMLCTDVKTKRTQVEGVRATTETADLLAYRQIEVTDARLEPIDVPSLDIPAVETAVSIPKVNIPNLPLSVDITNGNTEFTIQFVDWCPRWGANFTVDAGPFSVKVRVKFGLDAKLSATIKFFVENLHVAIQMKNAVLNMLEMSAKLSAIAVRKLHIGMLRIPSFVAKTSARAMARSGNGGRTPAVHA